MITSILTFLSSRVVSVVITSVVVVAAVPVLIIAIHGHTVTISTGPVASASRHGDDSEKARVVLVVRNAGDRLIVRLNDEESTCDATIAQLAAQSKLPAAATAAELQHGRDEFHASVARFDDAIQTDEDELENMNVVTTETQQTFLVRINEIQVLALGEDGQSGELVTVCQTIVVEIQQVIVVAQTAPGGEGDDGDARLIA